MFRVAATIHYRTFKTETEQQKKNINKRNAKSVEN